LQFTNKKVLLFDLDGTLVDSVPDLALSINAMLEALGRRTYPVDTIRQWVGNGAQTLVKRGLSGNTTIDETLEPKLVAKALEIFLDYYGQNVSVSSVAYPEVLQTLSTLKERGYRLTIVTNKPIAFVEPLLTSLGLYHLFEYSIGGDSLEQKKPHPLPLLHVCEKLDVSLQECVMIGDSKNDILAAKGADMQSIAVSYGYNYGEDIALHKPEAIVDSFQNILALFEKQG
jgi:phosphoglycolate phosphatase